MYKRGKNMPLTQKVSFTTALKKGSKVQIPELIAGNSK